MRKLSTQATGSLNHLPTSFLLMAWYDGQPILPIEEVCRDFLAHLTPEKLLRKTGRAIWPAGIIFIAENGEGPGVRLRKVQT